MHMSFAANGGVAGECVGAESVECVWAHQIKMLHMLMKSTKNYEQL